MKRLSGVFPLPTYLSQAWGTVDKVFPTLHPSSNNKPFSFDRETLAGNIPPRPQFSCNTLPFSYLHTLLFKKE